MDPRHPEQAIPRVKELIAQYDKIIKKIGEETVASKLGADEREGSLVVQELCLTAPRLHDAMVQASRNRRTELNRLLTHTSEPAVVPYFKVVENSPKPVEKYVAPNQAETVFAEPKPKRKTTKKKASK